MNELDVPSLPVQHSWSLRAGFGLMAAGVWLMTAPFFLRYYPHVTATANDLIVGLVITVLAIVTTIIPDHFQALRWTSSYIGLWLMAAPFVLSYLSFQFPKSGAVPMWNDIITGAVVWFLSYVKAMNTGRQSRDFA
jgi:hypothetical protein